MPRIMYDSVTAADIPRGAGMVAGYVDGIYRWSDADWARFPKATKVRITVGSGTLDADVADMENGDYTPDQAAAWEKRKIARDGFAVSYFSISRLPQMQQARERAKVDRSKVGNWFADWNGIPKVITGSLATQYQHPPASGGHYDLSAVVDYWPGVDPPPPSGTGGGGSGGSGPPPSPPPDPTPPPTPPPPPPPSPVQGVNDTRAAWQRFADFLVNGVTDAYNYIQKVIQDLEDL